MISHPPQLPMGPSDGVGSRRYGAVGRYLVHGLSGVKIESFLINRHAHV